MISQPGASTPKDGMSEVPTADLGDCYDVQEVAFARRSVDWQGSINKACVTLWNRYPETPSSASAGERQEEGPETVFLGKDQLVWRAKVGAEDGFHGRPGAKAGELPYHGPAGRASARTNAPCSHMHPSRVGSFTAARLPNCCSRMVSQRS